MFGLIVLHHDSLDGNFGSCIDVGCLEDLAKTSLGYVPGDLVSFQSVKVRHVRLFFNSVKIDYKNRTKIRILTFNPAHF